MNKLFFIFLSSLLVFSSLNGNAVELTRRNFLLGTAATAALAPTLTQIPSTTATADLPPVPPGYLDKRFADLFKGRKKQWEDFMNYVTDKNQHQYYYNIHQHNNDLEYRKIKKENPETATPYYYNRTEAPEPVAEYDEALRAHAEQLLNIERRLAMEFKVSLDHVAEEIERMYFNQIDFTWYFGKTDRPGYHSYYYRTERLYPPLGIEVRDRYLELLAEYNPQQAYSLLYSELYERYYNKGFLYFQPELPAGFPLKNNLLHSESLFYFLETENPIYSEYYSKYEVSKSTSPTPRIVQLKESIKKLIPHKFDFENNVTPGGVILDIHQRLLMENKEYADAIEHANAPPKSEEAIKVPQLSRRIPLRRLMNALAPARNHIMSFVQATTKAAANSIITESEGKQTEATVENPNGCPQLLISHQPETPMPIVQEQQDEKVKANSRD